MCLDCNNSLCSLDILPSLSISTSFPISSSFLFSNHPSICWSLCPRFSCDFSVYHALLCLFFLPCSGLLLLLFFFCFSFQFSYFSSALLFMYCLTTVLFCCLPTLCLWRPSYLCLLPFRLSLFPPSFLFSFRCLSVGRWSQSSETPSPVRRAPACAAVGPSAAQQPCATPHA